MKRIPAMKRIICSALSLLVMLSLSAQKPQKLSKAERLKQLMEMQIQDSINEARQKFVSDSIRLDYIENFELPPLSIFLDAITENATIKRAESQVRQAENNYKIQKRDWLNYFRLQGSYGYGRYNVLANNSSELTPVYQTSMASAQQNFNIGATVSIGLGDLLNRGAKLKDYKFQIEQLRYSQEEVMEARRLLILEAYNEVSAQLATIRAKAETMALYNAEMKIIENRFIQGDLDIVELSLERARRSGALVDYEQARISLHSSIVQLEMLTNVKIIKE